MKSSSHRRFTSAISTPSRSTLNLIFTVLLLIPAAFTFATPGVSIREIFTGHVTTPIESTVIKAAAPASLDPAPRTLPYAEDFSGNQFRLSDTDWVYNLDTKKTPGISGGTWLVKATLFDGSVKTAWISIKK